MPLKTEIEEKKPGLYQVSLDGRLDTDTSKDLEKSLESILAKEVRAVRFELSNLVYISSMGIRILFKTFRALKQKRAMFHMVGVQPQIRKVLDIAQALPPETVFASVQEADDYFDAMQRKALGQDADGG
ncbi:MAG TPA: STAS domain-containing protein [Planctomycetota bacterium]|jgi:anti-anti-sigma factor|nr:STAS domain-containing protein [Planctomycetota bacterium]